MSEQPDRVYDFLLASSKYARMPRERWMGREDFRVAYAKHSIVLLNLEFGLTGQEREERDRCWARR